MNDVQIKASERLADYHRLLAPGQQYEGTTQPTHFDHFVNLTQKLKSVECSYSNNGWLQNTNNNHHNEGRSSDTGFHTRARHPFFTKSV